MLESRLGARAASAKPVIGKSARASGASSAGEGEAASVLVDDVDGLASDKRPYPHIDSYEDC